MHGVVMKARTPRVGFVASSLSVLSRGNSFLFQIKTYKIGWSSAFWEHFGPTVLPRESFHEVDKLANEQICHEYLYQY